jgi:vacuolar protein sorting-associated protein 13A/C
MDQQFQAKRRSNRARNRPKHAIGGISSGAKALGTGVLSGVEGLAMRPLEGAEREGVGGFLKGVGKGIAGYLLQKIQLTIDLQRNRLLGCLILPPMSRRVYVIPPRYLIEILLIDSVDLDSLPRIA